MADPKPDSFVKVQPTMTADRRLTDAEFRCLVALESWAWDKPDCFPTNVSIAERCGWYGKGKGKPARSKVKAVLFSLEDKGFVRRVVVVDAGLHRRERIVLNRLWRDGSESGHPRPENGPPMAEIPATGSLNPGHPRPDSGPSLGQNRATGGRNPGPQLDPVTDPGNQTQGIDPPHTPTKQAGGGGGGVEKIQYDPVRDDPELRRMLAGLAEVGVRHVEQKRRVKALAHWLLARLEDNPTISGIAIKLWRIVSGKTSVDDAFGHWSGQMIPF